MLTEGWDANTVTHILVIRRLLAAAVLAAAHALSYILDWSHWRRRQYQARAGTE